MCLDFLGLLQDNLSKHEKKIETTKFNDLSGLGIPEILMNIMSYYGFAISSISIVILKCCSALVPCYRSKVFSVFETKEGGIYNILTSVKNKINADNLHPEESLITSKAVITLIVNTLKKIIIPTDVYDTYVSHYYDIRHVEFLSYSFFCQTSS